MAKEPVLRSAAAAGMLLMVAPALAVPLDPDDYSSLGSLDGSAIVIDTSALTLNGGTGGVLVSQGGSAPDIAVFAFDGGSVLGDVTVTGSNALAILFRGAGTVAGTVSVTPSGQDGVAGGGDGGAGRHNGDGTGDASNGQGPGGGSKGRNGVNTNAITGGSGGGFGSAGGDSEGGPGGQPYGDPLRTTLEAGSGGGGGGAFVTSPYTGGSPGGAGGGALEIGALTTLLFDGASVLADGAAGGDLFTGGGGGSGGGILLHAYDITILAGSTISANGGVPGRFPGYGFSGEAGACGGAGRIEILHNTGGSFTNDGIVEAAPGDNEAYCNPPAQAINIVSVLAADGIGDLPAVDPPQGVPAPGTVALFVAGLAGLRLTRRHPGRAP